MSTRQIIAGIVLVDFIALNAYAAYAAGLSGFVEFVSNLTPWGWVLTADLLIALTMVMAWMWRDARTRGRNPLGYVLLTLATGSVGPLVYLLSRSEPGRQDTHDEAELVASQTPA